MAQRPPATTLPSRKLGGGRVLGGGKGLAPRSAHPPRAPSPFAPSESSTVSFRSRNSTPISLSPPSSGPLPDFSQDLASNVTLAGPSNGASPGNRLACPICEEEMLTLLQLNRHLDDVHQELPAAEQDEVKSWFDKQVYKAKRFQPLSLLHQKLRGVEAFESNETQPMPAATAPGRTVETVIDPEELIIRKHWQRPNGNDACTDPLCDKKLGPLSGSVNCRKCGRLFCEEHTMYQMKLSRSAAHEPVRGVWCRVCETCYKSREGYNDHNGLTRDHTADFAAIRAKKVERQRLEVQRLEKRLTKLTRLLAEAPPETATNSGLLAPLAGQRSQRKAIEQSVVTWEDDAAVPKCPFCKQEFRSWTFRRHHCRMCGRVVCADPETGCSSEVGLNVANPETARTNPPPTHAQIQEAAKIRKRLTDAFGKYDQAAKRVRNMPTDSPTQLRLQKAIYVCASSFLHANLIPLKSVPAMLRTNSSNHRRLLSGGNGSIHSSPLRNGESAGFDPETSSLGGASEVNTAVSALEMEEKETREKLVVLEEQRFMVQEMINQARGSRRFEEVGALSKNLEELDKEIETSKNLVAGVEERWEGLNHRNLPSPSPAPESDQSAADDDDLNDAPIPFYNTTFSAHRVSPLYIGSEPLSTNRLHLLSQRLRDRLVGDVVRGVEVGLGRDGEDFIISRADDMDWEQSVDPGHFLFLPLLLLRMPTPPKTILSEFLATSFDCRVSPMRLGTRSLTTSWESWIRTAGLPSRGSLGRDMVLSLGFYIPPSDTAVGYQPAEEGAAAADQTLGLKSIDVIIQATELRKFVAVGKRLATSQDPLSTPSASWDWEEDAKKRRRLTGRLYEEGWEWRAKTEEGGSPEQQPFLEALACYLKKHLGLNLFHPGVSVVKIACGGFVMSETRLKLFNPAASRDSDGVSILGQKAAVLGLVGGLVEKAQIRMVAP
ncbi:carboxypeptidase Y-deficient [Collariella sp. IMI 366227]|nr:carboxypeptidase Y-deficient [Collariella sp. IMI 366227]